MEELGRGDLDVVGAFQREVDLGGAGEALHHDTAVLPQEGVLGGAPAVAGAEQVQQRCRLLVGVTPAQRFDTDLGA